MGGDHGPEVTIAGLDKVSERRPDVRFILFGRDDRVRPVLDRYPRVAAASQFVHCDVAVRMDDKPSQALRQGRWKSSMWKAIEAVKTGDADVCVSAGNTGALMAMSKVCLRTMAGIERPAIAAIWPTIRGESVVLDVGANVECRPLNLVQFGVLGAVYSSFKHGKARPTVGILSNGTEEGKGTELTRAAHRVLSEHASEDFEYTGYVEGGRLFGGGVDVVVTDGFTGNVALKLIEATGRLIGGWLREAVNRGMRQKLGALLLKSAFGELKHRLDPDTYGAAPLLGVGGVAFICHGGSSSFAIATALRLSARSVDEDLLPKLADAVARNKHLFDAAKGLETQAEGAKPPRSATVQEESS